MAAFLVLYLFPRTRTEALSFFGTSRVRSACVFFVPILCAWIAASVQSGYLSNKVIYYLVVGGVSILVKRLGQGTDRCDLSRDITERLRRFRRNAGP